MEQSIRFQGLDGSWKMSLDSVFDALPIPTHVRRFVGRTINRALHGDPVEVAADFLFGREDLIPDMFARLLKLWEGAGSPVATFQYYLERHIALDGDEHGPAARATCYQRYAMGIKHEENEIR